MLTALSRSQFNDSRTNRHVGELFPWADDPHNHSARISNTETHRDEPLAEAPADRRDRAILGVTPLAPRIAASRRMRHNGSMTKSDSSMAWRRSNPSSSSATSRPP